MYAYLALSVGPYPDPALSAGQLALIAVVPVLALAAWLILVFVADREPRHRGAETTSLPQPRAQGQEREQPERKAAA